MTCAKCGHDSFDHGHYEWLRIDGKMTHVKISTACAATIDLGGDLGKECHCRTFEQGEEEETEEERAEE